MSMTHGSNGRSTEESTPPDRPPSVASSSSGSGSSKHVKCIGRYVLTGQTLGKGNFARVEAAVHTLTRAKVSYGTITFVRTVISECTCVLLPNHGCMAILTRTQ